MRENKLKQVEKWTAEHAKMLTKDKDKILYHCKNGQLQTGQFSLKSHYQTLIHIDIPNINKCIWKLREPLKINFLYDTCAEVSFL